MKLGIVRAACGKLRSPPSRGAWIEICAGTLLKNEYAVAPLAGGVD